MQYRTVKKNEDKLSILGYGCMRFPTKGNKINEEKAEEQLLHAIEQGVNYLDTAYPYHNGKSEPFLGKFLTKHGLRDKIKIATKLPTWMTKTKAEMHEILNNQLKNLQTDYIDYYLIHGVSGETWDLAKERGVIEFLDEALEQKKIVNAGFSFHGKSKDFSRIVDDYDWKFCQIQYNILDTTNQAGTKGLKYAASKDMAVIIMEPLRGGSLAKKPPKELRVIYDSSGKKYSAAEWALRWLWNQPEVTVVLSGMTEDEHIQENIRIANEIVPDSLSKEDISILNQVGKRYRELMKIGCTGCNYCMPCPHGVNIPGCFQPYNDFHIFGDRMAKMMYIFMNGPVFTQKSSMASKCVNCGECEEKCPQQIPIREKLAIVKKEMEGFFTKPLIWMIRIMFSRRRK